MRTFGGIGAMVGAVAGVLAGLLAVRLTNQALCPHAILGPCSTLSSRGRTEIIVLGVLVGLVAGVGIGRAFRRPV